MHKLGEMVTWGNRSNADIDEDILERDSEMQRAARFQRSIFKAYRGTISVGVANHT